MYRRFIVKAETFLLISHHGKLDLTLKDPYKVECKGLWLPRPQLLPYVSTNYLSLFLR